MANDDAPAQVEVRAERVAPSPFDLRDSDTVRTQQDLQRTMPSSIFEALRDIPNVSTVGGPRASGMSFNIRGYSDREDVQVKLDGVPKGFEKYRFGGTFIEPDLLKAVLVQRGPRITNLPGALGGTVSATTKDAADLLRPGQSLGATAKLGHAFNNDEALLSLNAYGAPSDNSGLLLNWLRRDSDDFQLPDGSLLPLSATNTRSMLLKGNWAPAPGARLALSATGYKDSGPQPYDATGGEPGLFGEVQRAIRDRTLALEGAYSSGPWVNLRLAAGTSSTQLEDVMQPGQTPFANAITGTVTDDYDYTNRSIDLSNTSRIDGLPFDLDILAGLQWLDTRREVSRQREKIPGDGFEPSIPPGDKRVEAAWLQARLGLGPVELLPGIRYDRFTSTATGGTADVLATAGEAQRITLQRSTPSIGVLATLWPDRLWGFFNQTESFRPPLIDEYFTQGAFGRCTRFLLGPALAPASQICGDLYQPQEAMNREGGFTYEQPIPAWRGLFDAKATWFRIDTTQLLRSIQAVSATEVGQPGWEKREGLELEASLRTPLTYARAGYGRIRGTVDEGGGVRTPSNPQPLYNVPGDTISLSAGGLVLPELELGFGWQRISARRVIVGIDNGQDVIGTQAGYALWSLNAAWTPTPRLQLRLAVDNLANTSYRLSNGFGGGLGSEAPGRNVRIALVAWL